LKILHDKGVKGVLLGLPLPLGERGGQPHNNYRILITQFIN
jgi:hypothetical protein